MNLSSRRFVRLQFMNMEKSIIERVRGLLIHTIIRSTYNLFICCIDTYFPQQERTGKIRLNFVDSSNESNTWEDLQAHKKTLGVIGIVHCPNWEDLTGVEKEFSSILARTPNTSGICLAFSPMEHQRDLDHGIVVMIPNDGKLALYLSTLLIDFTKNLLDKFETMYKTIDKVCNEFLLMF